MGWPRQTLEGGTKVRLSGERVPVQLAAEKCIDANFGSLTHRYDHVLALSVMDHSPATPKLGRVRC
jgi:hypothetical protein